MSEEWIVGIAFFVILFGFIIYISWPSRMYWSLSWRRKSKEASDDRV